MSQSVEMSTQQATDGALELNVHRTIHGGFEAQARSSPHQVAVRCRDVTVTYGQLDARANALARRLRAAGVVRESLVGVCLPRSPELLVSLLAVLKAGGAYVPLSLTDPARRRRHVLDDARPMVVITDLEHMNENPLAQWPLLCVDGVANEEIVLEPGGVNGDLCEVDPHQLAYVIYTSGSSGKPKGVACHHLGVSNYLRWAVATYASHGDGGAPVFSSFGFDMVVPNLYAPLWCGQTVHVIPDDQDLSAQLTELLASGPYGFIKLTPGQLDVVASMVNVSAAGKLASLLAVGADNFPVQALERWRELDPHTPLLNEYGPTEASVANSYFPIPQHFSGKSIPIGKPIPHTTMYLLDENLRRVGFGEEGEIFIGGVCCARGYLGRPGTTAKKFVPDPYSAEPGVRMYRTGDRATWDSDGNVVFLGRDDRQLKIHGYRVEPGEVESVLRRHPAVRDAAVIGESSPADGQLALKAHVVVTGEGRPDQFIAWLREYLPEYAIPTSYTTVDTIPLDANGKVDRSALQATDPEQSDVISMISFSRETGPLEFGVEDALRQAWTSVLGVEDVRREDNFFELGGDSILSVRLASALRSQGYDLSLTEVFKHPTLGALAPYVIKIGTASTATPAAPLAVRGPMAVTPVQQWFFDRDLEVPPGP